jgi:predicted phage terminase large subunit-like protein
MPFGKQQLWSDVDSFVREFGDDPKACEQLAKRQPKFAALLPYSLELMLPYQKLYLRSPKRKKLLCGGRGIGKTRTTVNALRDLLYTTDSDAPVLFTAPAYNVLMESVINGPSGIMRMFPPHERPAFNSISGVLTFDWTPIRIICRVAERPRSIRSVSAQAWFWDEIAGCLESQAFLGADCVYKNALYALRESEEPRWYFTSTPKPWAGFAALLKDPSFEVIRATSFDNTTLPTQFFDDLRAQSCTREFKQEALGELLDVGGTYINQSLINSSRRHIDPLDLHICIALDPATTSSDESDETGIVIGGVDEQGHVHIIEDLSGHYKPSEWANLVVGRWKHYAQNALSCQLVAETNQGGEMVEATLRSALRPGESIPLQTVHAKSGKRTRISPCVGQLESGRVHFPIDPLTELEYQLTTFTGEPGKRDDRADAWAYLITELLLKSRYIDRDLTERSYR